MGGYDGKKKVHYLPEAQKASLRRLKAMQVEDTIKCTKATAHFRGSTGPDTVQASNALCDNKIIAK